MLTPCRLLLCQLAINISYHVVSASLCLGGSDIFAKVRENSPTGEFIANLSIVGDPGANSIRLCLTGDNADWFFLEGRTIRLNSSFSRNLDREVQGSILMAALTCYEKDIIQSQYRIMVEIMNENDNRPRFLQRTVQPFFISELATVNSVVFTVKAVDADGDTLTYLIDYSSPDASYFRIDLPNSGKVFLDKPLDYETQTQLQLVIYAVESNTREKYNATANLIINLKDGDDQYPQFLPCTLISQASGPDVCTNPIYTSNITEKDQDNILKFSPGPIHAKDGDKSLDTPLQYTILAGDDDGRFAIANLTGEVTLTRRVENRQLTPTFRMRLMASQLNDPKKYSVTTALIRVLAENRFPPVFNKTIYKGFIIESSSPATLVSTYGNRVLLINAIDRDFRDGVNPNIHYSLQPHSASDGLYHMTQEGVLIARTDRLRAFDRDILEVVATDEESGEVAKASVDIEVLQRGQPVPRSPFGEERLFADMDAGMAGGIAGVILLVLVAALVLLLRLVRRRRDRQDPSDRGSVALGKHPNVVNSACPVPLVDEVSYHNEAFSGDHEPCTPGRYTRREEMAAPPRRSTSQEQNSSKGGSRLLGNTLPILVIPEPLPRQSPTPITSNGGRTPGNIITTGVAKKDENLEEERQQDNGKELTASKENGEFSAGLTKDEAVAVLELEINDARETQRTAEQSSVGDQSDAMITNQITEPKEKVKNKQEITAIVENEAEDPVNCVSDHDDNPPGGKRHERSGSHGNITAQNMETMVSQNKDSEKLPIDQPSKPNSAHTQQDPSQTIQFMDDSE
ncbi:cadherin-related family member 5 isoform X1 [Osmerus eperlanus]|uniref:cadherin-related family member 5 isoform X1 n=1 Tax=Osmerus eperlanus TaxID=29151 RepID=UPI002E0E9640